MSKLAPLAAVVVALALVAVSAFAVFHHHKGAATAPKPAIVAVAPAPAPAPKILTKVAAPQPEPLPSILAAPAPHLTPMSAIIERLKHPAFMKREAEKPTPVVLAKPAPAAKPVPTPVVRPVEAKPRKVRHRTRQAPKRPAETQRKDAEYGERSWSLDGFIHKLVP